jgi:hypothetical protein
MFQDAFSKCDRLEVDTFLGAINPLLDGSPFSPETATILSVPLRFYPGCRLLDIADHTGIPARRVFAVVDAHGTPHMLDWTNETIYRLNQTIPLTTDDRSILDYVRFFFAFVRGRHGRFQIVDTIDDIVWREEPPAMVRKTLGGFIEPLKLIGTESDGSPVLNARLMFKDSLFKARVHVGPNGQVTLKDEELVIEEIPVQDDVIGL